MLLYLGVDGGGTGCRAAICDRAGAVLGQGQGPAANVTTDPVDARDSVLAAAGQALAAAGCPGRAADLHAVLGLAGASITGAAEAFADSLPFARSVVLGDAVIAMRGALSARDGVAAIIGTGSIFARQSAGAVRTIGGWGLQLGDHASGARIGRGLLEAALLAHDGLIAASPLAQAVLEAAGGPDALVLFAREARPADFARYAPRVLALAGQDAVADALLGEADCAINEALDRLRGHEPLPICFLGGLGPAFSARLAQRYGPAIVAAEGSALDGALALARALA